MKKYYDILGIQPGATEREIRKAYRKLALMYHPDKNPSPEAAVRFVEITHAYEMVTGKKSTQTQTTKKPADNPEKKTKEERIKDALKNKKEIERIRQLRRAAFYAKLKASKLWRYHSWVAKIGLVLAILLLADQVLPTHNEEDRIHSYIQNVYMSSDMKSEIYYLQMKSGHGLWVSKVDNNLIYSYPEVIIQRTWFLHDPICLNSLQGFQVSHYPIHYSFSASAFITAFLFLLPFLCYYFWKDNDVYLLLMYIGSYPIAGLMLYFLAVRFHLLHILVLGFF